MQSSSISNFQFTLTVRLLMTVKYFLPIKGGSSPLIAEYPLAPPVGPSRTWKDEKNYI